MKTEELIENYLVYTDNGIEKVHWCNVNGVKELVSPKGKVYGYVPDYFEIKRLQEQLKEANQLILSCKRNVKSIYSLSVAYGHYWAERDAKATNVLINTYLRKWGVK